MQISQLMTRTVRTARVEDRLSTIASMMWEFDCGCVPLVDQDGKPVGMITDRDICMAALTTGLPIAEIAAKTAMSRALYAVHEQDSVEKAEEMMRAKQVRRLPVIDKAGKLVGLLSLGDLIRRADVRARKAQQDDGLSPNTIAWTLAGVSQPYTVSLSAATQPAKA